MTNQPTRAELEAALKVWESPDAEARTSLYEWAYAGYPSRLSKPEAETLRAEVRQLLEENTLLPQYIRALLERAEDSERLGWLLTSLDFGRFCEQYGTNLQTSRATGTEKEWRAAIDDARQKEAADGK